jgi:uncharacterized membrane protein
MPKLKKPRVVDPIEPELARPDWIVICLALAGVAVAGYLTALKLGGTQAFLCRDNSGCDVVQASRYSVLAGVPTAMWGAAIYLAIAVLAAIPRTVRRWQAAFMLASGAVAFSLYLTSISIFVIGATCKYCLASGGIAVALLVAMVWRRPSAQGGRARPTSPAGWWVSASPCRLDRPRRRLHLRRRLLGAGGYQTSLAASGEDRPSSTAPSGDPPAKNRRPGSGLPRAASVHRVRSQGVNPRQDL